jgi:ADP-heptose:LPS heptosyltransferase
MKKILIIRFSSIGDIVLTTPVVRCLKEQAPGGVEIHYLTKQQYAPLLAGNPHISHIHTITSAIGEVLPALRKEHFDRIVDLHRNFRSVGVWLRLRIARTSFKKLNIRKWLLVKFKINLLPDRHVVDRYFGAVVSLGIKNDGRGLDYFISGTDDAGVSGLKGLPSSAYVAFVIGARYPTKCFPADMVADVCSRLTKTVILLGGQEDREKGEWIRERGGDHLINTCGRLTFNQSALVIRHAARVITNDTGMMHIAAAFNKPILSLWGNTVPAFGMSPYLPGDAAVAPVLLEVKGLSCRPCSKLGYEKCPRGHFNCMRQLPADRIVTWANAE